MDKEEPTELADNLKQLAAANIVTYGCDIANRDAVESLAAELSQRNYAPHSVALTAGITFYNDWIETDNETWDRDVEQIFNVNLAGPINVARSFLPIMEKNNWGRMVLVGSIAGRMGGLTSQPHYAASKGGVHSLTRWLASKYAPSGVLVNGLHPVQPKQE